jgi:hypothetical protein
LSQEIGAQKKSDNIRTIKAEPFEFSNLAVAAIVVVEIIDCISPIKVHTLPLTATSTLPGS